MGRLRDGAAPFERVVKEFVFAGLFEEGEDLERDAADDLLAPHAGDAPHGAVPARVAALAVEVRHAVEAGVKGSSAEALALEGVFSQSFFGDGSRALG